MPTKKQPPAPKSRRARGTGSVFFSEARGLWVGRVLVGGRRVERSDPTQAGLVRKLAAASPAPAGVTVKEWCERWLEGQAVRPQTLEIRTGAVSRWIVPVLGHLRLSAVGPAHVAEAAKKWAAAGLKPGTVNLQLSVLRTAMGAAARAGLRSGNPVTRDARPRSGPPAIDPFTRAELDRIVAFAVARPGAYPLALLAATGCRVGEACALDAADFDPAAGTVRIHRSCDIRRRVGPTKTPTAVRTVRVPSAALPALRAARGGRADGPLFVTATGRRANADGVRKWWVRACQRLGLRFRNLHQLRHSFATAALAAGYGLPDVARHLGDKPSTVLRIYAHATGADVAGLMEPAGGEGRGKGL